MVSIVICTFNRSEFLVEVLKSLTEQTEKRFEILVIDNNSTDNTNEITHNFKSLFSHFKYFFELQIGLSNARNRGVVEAKGDYIAFIDDDCILPENWVELAFHIIENENPDIFGGPVFPLYKEKKPEWYKDEYISHLFGDIPRNLKPGESLIGCNFIVRKSLFEKIGLFKAELGMSGKQILYGEETEFQLRYLKLVEMSSLFYHPKLYVYHYVRPEKMTLNWNIKSFIGRGRSRFYKNENQKIKSIPAILNLIVYGIKLLALGFVGLIKRDRNKYTFYQNYVIERLQGNFKKVGYLLENIKGPKTK